MSAVQTAYDPVRIQQLTARVAQAADELAAITCNDPAASEALRAVRLTRTNLEDLWMPLLGRIRTSQAMISWLESSRSLVTHGREMIVDWIADQPHRPPNDEFTRMTDEQLLAVVEWFPLHPFPFDVTGARTGPAAQPFAALATALAARVEADDEFADRLLGVSRGNHVVAFSTGIVLFPPDFVERLARRVIVPPSPFDDLGSQIAATAATSVVLRALLDADPAHSLDLLSDDVALRSLAGWAMLDQRVVSDLVHRGLYTAVAVDPNRMVDGYSVLRQLTELAANGFDDGFAPGVSLGVATSMVGYVDTLATGLGLGTATTVTIHEVGTPGMSAPPSGDDPFTIDPFMIDLGTYDDVRNLFGTVCREPQAQAVIGLTIGAHAAAVFDRLGKGAVDDSAVRNVARFGELIGTAVTAEQAEMVAAAVATSSRRRALSDEVSFGVGQAATALGAGPMVSLAANKVAQFGAATITDVETERMPDALIADSTYLAIVVGTVRAARADPSSAGPEPADDPARLALVDAKLDEIDALAEAGDRTRYAAEVEALMALVDANTPRLERDLLAITDLPTVESLRGS